MNEKLSRCGWSGDDPLYNKYHDQEWGLPVYNDQKQFEFLVLESAQAGLSWLTILKRRENYRQAYQNFNPEVVANFGEAKLKELLEDEGIIRNKLKIKSSINNAKRFLEVQQEYGSFCNYIWGFVNGEPIINHWDSLEQIPAKTELSAKISKDMKKRGFKFIGPVIIYSHLQATGLVNDHLLSCFRYQEIINNY